MHNEDDHFTLLSKHSDHHTISICTHGIIHFNWQFTTLHFRPQEFVQIAHVLEQGSIGQYAQEFINGPVSLLRDESGRFTLKIGDVGLFLDSMEFLALVDLVGNALQRLGYIHAMQMGPSVDLPSTGPGNWSPGTSFSLN